ncbi:MAG TPA: hypothetical protein VF432_10935 [Thermoanaerobaculia bacterium]
MPQRRRRRSSEWKRIREVLLRRQASYGVAEVASLLGIAPETVETASGPGLSWEDIVALGLEHRWTYRTLTAACPEALPPLVRVVTRPVALPRYQWAVLRLLAARQAQEQGREITVSDLIEEAVSTAVLTRIEDWASLEQALPGVRAAAEWPEG